MTRVQSKEWARRVGTPAIALILAAGVAGCSSDSEKGPDAKTDETSQAPTEDAPTEVPGTATETEPDTTEPAPGTGTLADYVAQTGPGVEKQVMERFKERFSDVSVEAEGDNTLVYRYTYQDEMDADATQAQLMKGRDHMQRTAESSIFPGLEAAGIKNPSVKWVYLNSDGSEIATIQIDK